jgi:hypothetical protein
VTRENEPTPLWRRPDPRVMDAFGDRSGHGRCEVCGQAYWTPDLSAVPRLCPDCRGRPARPRAPLFFEECD